MSMMYKIFFAILVAGAIGGVLFAFLALACSDFHGSFPLFAGIFVVAGLVWGFINYIFIKAVLRIFVNKFHTLERVLVHTKADALPNVFLSNEIDEIEKSIVRITAQFSKLSSDTEANAATMVRGTRPSRYTGRSSR